MRGNTRSRQAGEIKEEMRVETVNLLCGGEQREGSPALLCSEWSFKLLQREPSLIVP